ncbi:AGE family epimerase/isomerase [uncultured Georgenia sp.]|uniref:AGE family epimerase/isomerase n=1 Tax=uncultured Georgenia sp. TaxID=378209 RepID=UPI00260F9462|nr:AGE family epimerase/isomerase [uncultured Georgenia sp.]
MTPHRTPWVDARTQLERVVLPFWLEHGVDGDRGGFFTCFDNRGRTRVSTDKFTWSQGRFVWLLARAAELARRGLVEGDEGTLLDLAARGAQFLLDHAVLPDGTTRFVVGRDGGRPESRDQPARSVYADWFVVMGLAELARQTGESRWLTAARPVLERSRADHLAGTAPTPPYAVPAGHVAFGPRMILTNTLLVVAQAAESLGQDRHTLDWLAEAVEAMLAHRLPDGTFSEMPGPDARSLVSRHRVPGHTIEGIWVALESLDLLGDDRSRDPLLVSLDASCRLGWDPVHGGLLRYADTDGPHAPTGTTAGTPYEELVRTTWSTKLWWVHSEASAATAIAAHRYGRRSAGEWFERIWDYTLRTFPGGADGAEWVQIRNRRGEPLDQVVALPVKDPFHVTRNLMQILELGATDLPVSAAAPPSRAGRGHRRA